MLSNKSKYAIRAVLYLCANSRKNKTKLSGKDVSEALKTPLAFTVKILQELAKTPVISSSKGPGGGFYLTKENCNSTLLELLEVFGDDEFFTSCALGLPDCSDDHPCPIHESVKKSRMEMRSVFQNKTIAEISKGIEDNSFVLAL